MFSLFPIAAFSFSGTAKRIKSFLFGDRVRPRPGCVLHCALLFELEHSGIFVARDKIVEVENEDGRKNIHCVEADDFLVHGGSSIYIACDKKTGAVLGTRSVADNARYAVGRGGDYNLLFDNCHMFTSSCITGNSNNSESLFTLLERTVSRKLNRGRPITWQVWNHEDDEEPSDGAEL
ncbi:MAG: lecithin retinol acyltransferase family protein [Desulfuromonadaceae bacterium]